MLLFEHMCFCPWSYLPFLQMLTHKCAIAYCQPIIHLHSWPWCPHVFKSGISHTTSVVLQDYLQLCATKMDWLKRFLQTLTGKLKEWIIINWDIQRHAYTDKLIYRFWCRFCSSFRFIANLYQHCKNQTIFLGFALYRRSGPLAIEKQILVGEVIFLFCAKSQLGS